MNKKGESIFAVARKTIYWGIAGIVITAIVFSVAGILAKYNNNLTHVPPQLKASLISSRFINIPECFAYQDSETERVYPGIIDLTKFTAEHLEESCYKTNSTKEFNFALKLLNESRDEQAVILTNKYFHNNDILSFTHQVLIRDTGGNLSSGYLQIQVMGKI